jgi:C-terminal processing protease CtpA/Prc
MKIKILLLIIWSSSICYGQVKYIYFSKVALEEDLSFFSEKLTSIHPIFLDKTFEKEWENKYIKTYKQLKDSMTQNEFYLLVSPLLVSLKDGHSNFICPTDQRKQYMSSGLSFPFSITIQENSIFITEYYGEDSSLFKGGEEITKINGIASATIINEMQKLIGGNSKTSKNMTIEMYFRTYLWMIYHFEKDYELYIRSGKNQIEKVFVKGITNEQFLKNKKRYQSIKQEKYLLSISNTNKTANISIHSFADLQGFCAFADSAFEVITENKIENLILDVRGNGGGRSIVVDSLMNFLTDKPYSQYKKIETRISSELKTYYKDKYPETFETIKEYPINKLVVTAEEMTNPHNKKNRFKGKMFLLIDGGTYSGAATFAGLFKEMNLGIIIGEETGGTISYYGDYWYLTMPHTGLGFYISPKRFIQYGGSNLTRGVYPDYLLLNKDDLIIKYTNTLIEKQRNETKQ